MISTVAATAGKPAIIVLQPNGSLGWRQAKQFFAVTALIAVAIAAVCAANGLWLVLPWTGFELLTLGIALYLVQRGNDWREVITIGASTIVIEAGRRAPERRVELPRYWAKACVEESGKRNLPARLVLRSHGKAIELGRFLGEEERRSAGIMLAAMLREEGMAPSAQ